MSLARLFQPVFGTLVDLLYPPHCVGCGDHQPPGVWLCGKCESEIRRIEGPKCSICGRPFDGEIDTFFVCPNCHGEEMDLEFAVSVLRSEGLVRELIHRFKYGREFHLRRVLGADAWKQCPNADHVHFYGFYIGNYPTLEAEPILRLCDLLNGLK